MRASAPTSNPYEVNCTRCRVSFPVGTRTCMHCGQPIGRSPAAAGFLERAAAPEDEAMQDLPLRAFKASPLTIVWLVAAVATVAYRACT